MSGLVWKESRPRDSRHAGLKIKGVSSKELSINYAKKKKIDFELIEPRKRKTVKKSYADNFLK